MPNQYAPNEPEEYDVHPDIVALLAEAIPDSPVWTPLLRSVQELADGSPEGDMAISWAYAAISIAAGVHSFVLHLDEGSDWGHVTLGDKVVNTGHCDSLREWVLDRLVPTRFLNLPHVRRGDPHPTAVELYAMDER